MRGSSASLTDSNFDRPVMAWHRQGQLPVRSREVNSRFVDDGPSAAADPNRSPSPVAQVDVKALFIFVLPAPPRKYTGGLVLIFVPVHPE
jgi:hypothetical protein